ncbi:probable galacturonosyltransferase 7 isoform X2 [Tanacetum coccineum]
MSDNIPFEIQMEIIKKVSNVKYLIRFRSVSKPWKSFIDSSDFVKGYGARNTHPHSHILKYKVDHLLDHKYICLVDDDNESFKVQQQQQKQEFAPFVMSPLLKQYSSVSFVVGTCHGLMALYCYHNVYKCKRILVIWNPFIGKSFGIALPIYDPNIYIPTAYGIGVCPVTSDPTVVKIVDVNNMPLHVEVFTLSSGVWNVIRGDHLSRQSIKLYSSGQAVDRFIYWGAHETTGIGYPESIINHMVLSFDLITKEFKVIDLPDSLINELCGSVSVSKLRESLVVYGPINVMGSRGCGVWVMDHDSSFRKLFTIRALVRKILGFSKSGEAIFEIEKAFGRCATLNVYDPCSQQIKNIGISGLSCSFFMGSYKESLLLLDHLDSHIY